MTEKQKKLFNQIAQIALPTFTILAFAFTSSKRPDIGLVFNLVAQIFWLYSGWQAWKKADQLGVFITAVIITILVVYGIINYWLL